MRRDLIVIQPYGARRPANFDTQRATPVTGCCSATTCAAMNAAMIRLRRHAALKTELTAQDRHDRSQIAGNPRSLT